MVVSFAERVAWAQRWQTEVCPHFPLLLDPERQLYLAFGLKRSMLRSWNLRTLLRYARYLLSGRSLEGIQGDSAQLDGDFLVDERGRLVHAHRSRDPLDRPTVGSLLKVIDEKLGSQPATNMGRGKP